MFENSISQLRNELELAADATHAEFHRKYHKSSLRFHGVKTPVLKAAFRRAFPISKTTPRSTIDPLIETLWKSQFFEERSAALMLMEKTAGQLTAADLPRLKLLTAGCEGWAHLDHLAVKVIGQLALNHGKAVYEQVYQWRSDKWLWTRRAAILVHELPARRTALNHDYAWVTFDDLLDEREFFIRKAIGWVLRTASRGYPQQVFRFLADHRDRVSGLTLREGARNLPDQQRIILLGK